VKIVAGIALAVGAAFFGLALMLGMEASQGFLFALGVTVALVPEGLLPTVTLSLARAAQRMAARNALVRHLEAVETLGSATFICTEGFSARPWQWRRWRPSPESSCWAAGIRVARRRSACSPPLPAPRSPPSCSGSSPTPSSAAASPAGSAGGWALAAMAIPATVAADTTYKAWRAFAFQDTVAGGPEA
jgi:hypothetical protein